MFSSLWVQVQWLILKRDTGWLNHFTLTEANQPPTVVLQGIVDHYTPATYIERVHMVIVSI